MKAMKLCLGDDVVRMGRSHVKKKPQEKRPEQFYSKYLPMTVEVIQGDAMSSGGAMLLRFRNNDEHRTLVMNVLG